MVTDISVDLGEISPRQDENFSYEYSSRLTGMYCLFTHAQFNRNLKTNMAESGQASEEANQKEKQVYILPVPAD